MTFTRRESLLFDGTREDVFELMEDHRTSVIVDWRADFDTIVDAFQRFLPRSTVTLQESREERMLTLGTKHATARVLLAKKPPFGLDVAAAIARILPPTHEAHAFRASLRDDTHCYLVRRNAWWDAFRKRAPTRFRSIFASTSSLPKRFVVGPPESPKKGGPPRAYVLERAQSMAAIAKREIRLERAIAARAVSAGLRMEGSARHGRILRAAFALESLATQQIAVALATSGEPDDALLSWARMTLVHKASSVVEADELPLVHALAIHALLDDDAGLARAKKLAGWALVDEDGFSPSDSADLAALLPRGVWSHGRVRKPRADVAKLVRAIRERSARDVAHAVKRLGRDWENAARRDEHPFTKGMVPLTLLLARERCRAAGVAWTDPGGGSWAVWRRFEPRRRKRKVPALERDLLKLVRVLQPDLRKKRARRQRRRSGRRADPRLSRS